jgi:MFS family permease
MEQMDSTVIATALPAIAADVDTSPISLKLALTAYLVSLAIFIPISGWMADRFGARRIFAIAIGVFLAGSIACAISGSLIEFVAARFLQGMGGAMMTPVGRLVLLRSTEKSQLVSAMAWLTIPALVGPMVGPPVGGFLTTFLSWHWIFLINIPIGLAGIVFAIKILPDDGIRVRDKVDWTGFLLSGTATSGIVFGLSVISLPVLPPVWGLAATGIGVLSLIAYLRHARAHPKPLLDPKIFRNRTFSLSLLGSSLFRVGSGAVPFLLPLMLQLGFGMSPFQSGMITFISAGRRHPDEICGQTHPEPGWFSRHAPGGSGRIRPLDCGQRVLHAGNTDRADSLDPVRERARAVDVLHRGQCPDLFRDQFGIGSPGKLDHLGFSAGFHRHRRGACRWNRRGGDNDEWRRAGSERISHRLLCGGSTDLCRDPAVSRAAAGCRRRRIGPGAQARRAARRLTRAQLARGCRGP